jgi:BirA family transcriptional regulator, biotin operon repressor / biotin---[acetyl-CoA-carboxylase] ligase
VALIQHSFIQKILKNRTPPVFLYYLKKTTSTMNEATKKFENGSEFPAIIIAETQTAGRGRQGRPWVDHPGTLCSTFCWRPNQPLKNIGLFTLFIALQIIEQLDPLGLLRLAVKWPNDLYSHDGKKMGGLLAEATFSANKIATLALGVGMNICTDFSEFSSEFRPKITSLQELDPSTNATDATALICMTVLNAYTAFLDGSYENTLPALWQKRDYLCNKKIFVKGKNETLTGIARGIDSSGQLILEKPDGERVYLNSAEVTLS